MINYKKKLTNRFFFQNESGSAINRKWILTPAEENDLMTKVHKNLLLDNKKVIKDKNKFKFYLEESRQLIRSKND